MSQTLSNSTYELSLNTSKQPSITTKQAQFGDGYKQITIDGINYEKEVWNVEWVPMDSTTGLALETLLLNSVNGEANYLYWQGPFETSSKYYTASNINRMLLSYNRMVITATLTREFPL